MSPVKILRVIRLKCNWYQSCWVKESIKHIPKVAKIYNLMQNHFKGLALHNYNFFSLRNKYPITMTAFELNWAWLKHYSSYGQWKIDSMITQAIHWIKLNNVWQTQFLIEHIWEGVLWNLKSVSNLNENIHLLPCHWLTSSANAKWHKTNGSIPSEIKKKADWE